MKTKWVLIVIVAICILTVFFEWLRVSQIHWSGSADVLVTMQVVDGKSGNPLQGVSVEIYSPFFPERPSRMFLTDKTGHVRFKNEFHASGNNNTVSISFFSWKVLVKNDRHKTVDDDFSKFVIKKSMAYNVHSVDLRVSLLE